MSTKYLYGTRSNFSNIWNRYVVGRSAEKIIPKLKEISADNERIAGAMSSGKGLKNRDIIQVENEYNKKQIAKMTPLPIKF